MRTEKRRKITPAASNTSLRPGFSDSSKSLRKKRTAFWFQLKNADGKSITKNGIMLIPFFSFLAFANTNARDGMSFSFKQGGSIKNATMSHMIILRNITVEPFQEKERKRTLCLDDFPKICYNIKKVRCLFLTEKAEERAGRRKITIQRRQEKRRKSRDEKNEKKELT